MLDPLYLTGTVLLCLGVLTLASFYRGNRLRSALPPGPKPSFFIGNLRQLPKTEPYKTFGAWSQIHGPLVYFSVFGKQFIVVNTWKASVDLFEERSAIYATRPHMVMAGQILNKHNTSIVFSKYDSRLKEYRKIVHSWLGRHAIKAYGIVQEIGTARLIAALLDKPEDSDQHIRWFTGSVIMELLYGIKCLPKNDPHLTRAEKLNAVTAKAMSGGWLCDSFPLLRHIPAWFPGAYFKQWAQRAKAFTDTVYTDPFEQVKTSVAAGVATPCWVLDSLVDEQGQLRTGEEEYNIMIAAGSLYSAAVDTATSCIRTFILMMIHNQEVQRKAHKELDAVLGDHLPTLSDRDSLPYVGCIIKETLRYGSVIPLLPHSLEQDDVYDGYFIPKGSCVTVNLWQVMHDPALYPEPDVFRPERFENPVPSVKDPEDFCYGMGRRSCLGDEYAKAWLFLAISRILFTFDIQPKKDASGQPVLPSLEFVGNHIIGPRPYECSFLPRDAGKVKIVRDTVAMC